MSHKLSENHLEQKQKAYHESKILLERDDGLKIIVPMTEFAAKWFGKGTRWCTASENNNRFETYAAQAPLYIIMMPNGDKLQFFSHKDNIQFMDANDEDVSKKYISENEYLVDILKTLDKTGLFIKYIPNEFKTRELCETAIKQNGNALQYLLSLIKYDRYKQKNTF